MTRTALPTLEELRAARLAKLSALRWKKETGGTVFNGMPIATDARSQTKYIGAVVGAQIDPDAVINWKMADGAFVPLDAEAITTVAMAVRTHVQACFAEAMLKVEIETASTAEHWGSGSGHWLDVISEGLVPGCGRLAIDILLDDLKGCFRCETRG